jgi:hypothetical protein
LNIDTNLETGDVYLHRASSSDLDVSGSGLRSSACLINAHYVYSFEEATEYDVDLRLADLILRDFGPCPFPLYTLCTFRMSGFDLSFQHELAKESWSLYAVGIFITILRMWVDKSLAHVLLNLTELQFC